MRIVEIPYVDPLRAFQPFAARPWSTLLDSAGEDLTRGRFAFIATRPRRTLVADDKGSRIDGQFQAGDPFSLLAEEMEARPLTRPEGCPLPFIGGAVGFLSYQLGRHLERAPARILPGQPELAVGFYDAVAGFDRVERRAWVVAATPAAEDDAFALAGTITRAPPLSAPPPLPCLEMRPDLDPARYQEQVRRVVAMIGDGEVFQVNFTQGFRAARPADLDPFALYRALRARNPAPFGAFLSIENGFALASASPERFLSLDGAGRIEARPIKGTRRRDADPAKDQALARALLASAKDRAENLMIADLLRNDIGRVAMIGSVKAPILHGLESHASVHHLVSVVEGRLRAGSGPVDLLRAAFPGGSITGAPKVRAMEIIDELEARPRGAYCGSALWIGYDGRMDSSILIRTVTLTADEVATQAGGGIVSDSDAKAEWREMMLKAAPALAVLSGEG